MEISYDQLKLLQEHAIKVDESTNAFIKRAIDETMERDNNQGI